jgi:hypothetical protein
MKRSGSSVPRNSSVPEPMCASYRLSRRREAGPVRACRIPPRAIAKWNLKDKILVEDGELIFLFSRSPRMDSSRNGSCLIHPDAAKSDGRVPTDDLLSD